MRTTFLLLLFAISALLISCDAKEKIEDLKALTKSAEDNNRAEAEFGRMFDILDEQGKKNGQLNKTSLDTILLTPTGAQVSVTTDAANNTATLRLTFPVNNGQGVLCYDGIRRQGTLVAVFVGNYRQANSTLTITTEDYKITNALGVTTRVDGRQVITNQGNEQYRAVIENALLTFETGETMTWNCVRNITRIAGQNTINPFDDVYTLTGDANGINTAGNPYTVTTTEALRFEIRQNPCARHPVTGKLRIASGTATLDVNYDPDGTAQQNCAASVSVNGRDPITISLQGM